MRMQINNIITKTIKRKSKRSALAASKSEKIQKKKY